MKLQNKTKNIFDRGIRSYMNNPLIPPVSFTKVVSPYMVVV